MRLLSKLSGVDVITQRNVLGNLIADDKNVRSDIKFRLNSENHLEMSIDETFLYLKTSKNDDANASGVSSKRILLIRWSRVLKSWYSSCCPAITMLTQFIDWHFLTYHVDSVGLAAFLLVVPCQDTEGLFATVQAERGGIGDRFDPKRRPKSIELNPVF